MSENKRNVNLKIRTIQKLMNDDPEEFELLTDADYECMPDGSIAITYDDSIATGMKGRSTILCSGDGSARVTRDGESPSEIVLEKAKTHHCRYATPYGSISISVTTSAIDNSLTEDGGELHFRYAIDTMTGGLLETEVFVSVG